MNSSGGSPCPTKPGEYGDQCPEGRFVGSTPLPVTSNGAPAYTACDVDPTLAIGVSVFFGAYPSYSATITWAGGLFIMSISSEFQSRIYTSTSLLGNYTSYDPTIVPSIQTVTA
jgi:hypothetical protein